ncbi:hypothetical protein ACOSQ3_000828 [Xanthoceras sorbifolium]
MTIILRYVDVDGFVRERFFEIVGVDDTNASTLKREICIVLDRYNILTENLRDCPYAYYIHYFAHRLQLALVAVSKEVHEVWLFFSKLSSVVNFKNLRVVQRLIKFVLYSELDLLVGVHILLLLVVLEISNVLCRALQMKSQDILNALNLVSPTKLLLQQYKAFLLTKE